jgi:putative tryptophan/tyrosine transport system substrate-binding protein
VAIDFESDPVAEGFVASLARPGRNITGTFLDQADLSGKWRELLKEISPKLTRVALFWDSSAPSYQLDAIRASGRSMAMEMQTLRVGAAAPARPGGGPDFEGPFAAAAKGHAQAIVLRSSPLVSMSGPRLANLAVTKGLPTISMFRENAAAGCLVAYGPSLLDGWRRLGWFAGRILKGTKPADLPIDRPRRFELILNLKTAKALGLTIPPSLLLRADEVSSSGPTRVPGHAGWWRPCRAAGRRGAAGGKGVPRRFHLHHVSSLGDGWTRACPPSRQGVRAALTCPRL